MKRLYRIALLVCAGAKVGVPLLVHVLRLREGVGMRLDCPLTCVAFFGFVYLGCVVLFVYVHGAVSFGVRVSGCFPSVSLFLFLFSRRRAVRS